MRLIAFIAMGIYCAAGAEVCGTVTDPQGRAVAGVAVSLAGSEVVTDGKGRFCFAGEPAAFAGVKARVAFRDGTNQVSVQFDRLAAADTSITVSSAGDNVFSPDPGVRVLVLAESLAANPGRPGMPVSIPGMPVESPAGGVKPPQYFLPGVAGDHGEPIAMFFQVGGFLFPNNLPANAHGNGYADPNVIIPSVVEAVETDGGSFNVREGNNSVNSAITFALRRSLDPEVRLTGDSRDVDVVGAWTWGAIEASYGNGFLARLEHRRQYKGNLMKTFTVGRHQVTVFGTGYYGFAFQPGLVPIGSDVATIDARQREETSNGAAIVNDVWRLTENRQLQFSGDYRYYTLDVRPNFGDGLIRQSEQRASNAEDVLYTERYSKALSLLAGVDVRREAPRGLNLDRADAAGVFQPVTSNNLTMNFYSPYAAVDGTVLRVLHYNAGYRVDEVTVDNQDLYRPEFSFSRRAAIGSPKGTLTFLPPERNRFLPTVSVSYGQAFHVNDPRIGTTAIFGGTIVSKARSYQAVATKTIAQTEFRVTLAHVTTAQQLARVSNDTGLQEDVGPGVLKSITATARRNFTHGFVQALFARADARDRLTGQLVPEAPRLIWGVLGSIDKLPFHLVARAEYEEVGRKPLGDGFVSVPVREFRGSLVRPFHKFDLGLNVFVASGYGGQTLETLSAVEQITGFPLRSYATASFTYHFR